MTHSMPELPYAAAPVLSACPGRTGIRGKARSTVRFRDYLLTLSGLFAPQTVEERRET